MDKYANFLASLILALIFFSFASVALAFVFAYISIALQDFLIYLHASSFMLAMVYAWHCDKHVRIDIFYQKLTPSKQNSINKWGTIFLLLPFCGFLTYISFHYVLSAWINLEASAESGGLPFVYLLKTLLLLMPLSLLGYALLKLMRKS